jgi:CopG family transcriptional regulator, nickel-responsive regulator
MFGRVDPSRESAMQRITITIDGDLMGEVGRFMEERGYEARSEVFRDLLRAGLERMKEDGGGAGDCVAALTYVYDHDMRALSKRLCDTGHEHHDLVVTTLHIHLNHESCMEVAILKGKTAEVRHYAGHLTAERGVRHGRLVTVPVDTPGDSHAHQGDKGHEHSHIRVRQSG